MRNLHIAVLAGIVALLLMSAAVRAQDEQALVNFNQAEIQTVIDDVSAVTGYTFIVDPSVRGRVTITSQAPLSPAAYFQVFLSTMRVHGYAVVPTSSGAFQIVPDQVGARSPSPVNTSLRGDRYATAVFRLDHASAQDALTVIRPILHPQGTANAAEDSNVVVVVDLAENLVRIRRIIQDLDRDTSVYEMVTLSNVSVSEMSAIVERLRSRTRSGEDDVLASVAVAPLPSSNSLLLRGSAPAVENMVALVRRVDAASVSNQNFKVVNLLHANGESVLPILQQMVEAMTEEGLTGRRPTVAHHAPTNSLVINADADVQREIERVIHQLDVRRPQVLVEGIIVEISDSAAEELGVQLLWTGTEDGTSPLAFTRYSSPSPDLLALAGAVSGAGGDSDDGDLVNGALRDAALSSLLGTRGGGFGFGGQTGDGSIFGLILNAVENDVESNVLATPSILAMDNEEASFISGQEIPITTGETLGADNSNPFRTIERQEVGVKLLVRPQITEGGTVRLYLDQEVSNVAGSVGSSSTELITNMRRVTTTVLADNGEIVVLGGLIEQNDANNRSQVPGLGNVPVLGRLFGTRGETTSRTNLMIFIRPTIIRSPADMQAVTAGRYNYITAQQRSAHPGGESSLEALVEMMSATTPRTAEEE
ncbi:type II secretion system secretin GspD [Maricaulis sp.]|uniref:type II secretion system secretin GspD n=1 Tax=Maricaulis sp. TaxID=1486257 RepID=UPI0026205525|nr:type II secretion system secretin GspD [Maricaulis sp.]MDF1767907.1 type II secretion system secretin GspD [Maricaulis sp.]